MATVFRTAIVLGVVLLAGQPRPARGMWPLDRLARTPGDTLTSEEWQERFQTWRLRTSNGADSALTARDLEALRKDAATGDFDPSLLARMAKQAQEGKLGVPTPAAPAPAPATSAAPGAPATGSAADSSGAGADFGAADSSSTVATFTSASDSAGAASNLAGVAASPSPFGSMPTPAAAATPVFVDRGFAPSFQASLNSTNDRMRLTSSIAATLADRSGVSVTASLGRDQELRLSQDSENESNNILTGLTVPLKGPGLSFGLSASNTRRNTLGARTTSGRTADQTENRLAALTASLYRQILPGVRLDLNYARNFTGDDQTIAGSQNAGTRSTTSTGNTYGAGLGYDGLQWLKLRGRYGRAVLDQVFTSSSFAETTPPPSTGDTLSIRADMPLGRWVPQLTAEFQVRRTENSYTDVSRTSSGGIQDATQFAVETETRFSRALRIAGTAEPWKFLSATYGVELARDSVSAALRTNIFEDAKRWRWNLGTTVRYAKGGHVRLALDGTRGDINKDRDDPKDTSQRLNPQTRRDESRSLSGEVQQSFTQTLKVRAYGNVELKQGFYAHEGPAGLGDRDDFSSQAGVDLDGQISAKIKARVQTYVRMFDQAFLDPRRSQDSRDETEYVVRQSFEYQVTPQVHLRQFYGLSSKIVDTIFETAQRLDTLNRNHFVQTTLNYRMTSRLALDGRFDYRLQDNGFYVPKPFSSQRIFAASARTKTDEIALGLRYALIGGDKLNFVSNQVATREHRTRFTSTGRPIGITVTDRGNLALGLESKIQMGSLKLDANVTRNQSFNVSLNRAVYYNVTSTLSYAF